MNGKWIVTILAALMATGLHTVEAAETTSDSVAAVQPKVKFRPVGRILLDGAVYGPDGNGFTDGVQIPDLRAGVAVDYGKWSAMIDVGFGYFKLSLKDIYIQYKFDKENTIRAGYFFHQFGLQTSTGGANKCDIVTPVSDTYWGSMSRNMGVMYTLNKPHFFMGASLLLGNSNSITDDKITHVSVGGLGRFVWRPYAETGRMLQVGVSAGYQSPTHKRNAEGESQPGSFTLSSNFPTQVVREKMIGATITNAGNQFKMTPELLLGLDRFALESQYYYMNINRIGMPHYQAQGCYAWLRCLLLGQREYTYAPAVAGIANPGPKTLEIVAGYDYVNANFNDIRGGISNDWSLTLNYYFNKYVTARLGYRYAYVRDSSVCPDRHENILQMRFQFKF